MTGICFIQDTPHATHVACTSSEYVSFFFTRLTRRALLPAFKMARCDMCRGTFEMIATCSSGLNVCLPCWRYDVDECDEPFTTEDKVMDVKMLGDADGPDGEIHGHISSNEYSDHEATEVDVSDDESFDTLSDTDHEPAMLVCEPEVELEPNLAMQEPEGEDDLWCLAHSGQPVIISEDSSETMSDTEPMSGIGGESDGSDANMSSDIELVPSMIAVSLDDDSTEESGCECGESKRRRTG
jgi:hypothetical protein